MRGGYNAGYETFSSGAGAGYRRRFGGRGRVLFWRRLLVALVMAGRFVGDLVSVTAVKLAFFAVLMFGFGYAMVPIYDAICRVTGLNNLLQPAARADEFSPVAGRVVRAEFDVNARGMVAMTPSLRVADLTPGKTYSVIYTLENLSDKPLFGQAVPSYSPRRADRWFKKIQCFCFDQLEMAPGEVRQAPVVFVLDPELPADVNTIALSYTFFEVEGRSR